MKRAYTNFTSLIMVAFLFGSGCQSKNQTTETLQPDEKINIAGFQSVLDSVYQSHPNSIGIMAHVESPKHGISWSGSVGYSDRINKTPLHPDQPALIASSIKTYISATVLRLQERGSLNIEDPIGNYLSSKTSQLLTGDGYDLTQIKIKHLLSHTSGIADYGNADYIETIDKDPKYRWTRDEQLALTVEVGDPLADAQELFSYTDANYLLATEIIEQVTQKPFYTAIRELLKYNALQLNNTWFPTLEDKPQQTQERVHQYWNEKAWGPNKIDIAWDSYDHDISWDLYGGGGIATTMKELAQFSHHLFNGKIIEDEDVLKLITSDVTTRDGIEKNYRLGISDSRINELQSFGHGGFWGTIVFYIPELDASISVCVLERNGKGKVIRLLLDQLTEELTR